MAEIQSEGGLQGFRAVTIGGLKSLDLGMDGFLPKHEFAPDAAFQRALLRSVKAPDQNIEPGNGGKIARKVVHQLHGAGIGGLPIPNRIENLVLPPELLHHAAHFGLSLFPVRLGIPGRRGGARQGGKNAKRNAPESREYLHLGWDAWAEKSFTAFHKQFAVMKRFESWLEAHASARHTERHEQKSG